MDEAARVPGEEQGYVPGYPRTVTVEINGKTLTGPDLSDVLRDILSSLAATEGLTQEGIGKVLGVTQATIHRLFRGETPGKVPALTRLCIYLGVDMATLIEMHPRYAESVKKQADERRRIAAQVDRLERLRQQLDDVPPPPKAEKKPARSRKSARTKDKSA